MVLHHRSERPPAALGLATPSVAPLAVPFRLAIGYRLVLSWCFSGNARILTGLAIEYRLVLSHQSVLRALDRLIAGEKYICLLGALSPINPTRMPLKLDFICGGRGPFPGATAMVVVLVVSLRQAWKAY